VSAFGFLMFLVTMALGTLCAIAFCMFVYIATFYTISPLGVRLVAVSLTEFLTGAIIPLPFLPDGLRKVIGLTPFASMQNLPLRIYSGNIAGNELLAGLLLQIFWVAALMLIGKLWLKRALTKVVIQGG